MSKPRNNDWVILGLIVIGVLVLVALVAALPLLIGNLPTTNDARIISDRIGMLGTYGDMFGILNPLFSGLALTGAIYAVILQRREHTANAKQEERLEKIRNETARREAFNARLNATSNIAQVFATQYASDPEKYDKIYRNLYAQLLNDSKAFDKRMENVPIMPSIYVDMHAPFDGDLDDLAVEPRHEPALRHMTLRGKMMFYRKQLEMMLFQARSNETTDPLKSSGFHKD